MLKACNSVDFRIVLEFICDDNMDLHVLHAFKAILDTRLSCPNEKGCLLYTGPTRKRGNVHYGVIRKTIYGIPMEYYAHRVAKLSSVGLPYENSQYPCSHLCHNSLCCNSHHISLEPQSVNNNRMNCFTEKRCVGHINPDTNELLPDCILV